MDGERTGTGAEVAGVRVLKFLFVAGVLVAAVALMSGVVQVLEEKPDGSVRVAPHVSKPAARWYSSKAVAVVGFDNVERVRSGVRRFVGAR